MDEQEALFPALANDSAGKITWGFLNVPPANAGDGGVSKAMRPIGHTDTAVVI